MAQRSAFFDAQNGDRTYASADFARLFETIVGRDGVVAGVGSELKVAPTSPESMAVEVGLGAAWIQGRYFNLYGAAEALEISQADSTNPRIDRVVVRMDTATAARKIEVYVKMGTPGSDPSPPSLTRDTEAWEISLAQVLVEANATEIKAEDITDERADAGVCGFVRRDVAVVTPEDFGAKGDGVSDDTQAFLDAVVYLKASGGGVLTSPGQGRTYVITQNIEVDFSNLIVDLNFAALTGSNARFVFNGDTGTDGDWSGAVRNCVFRNAILTGDEGFRGPQFIFCIECGVENVYKDSKSGTAFNFTRTRRCWMRNCWNTNSRDEGGAIGFLIHLSDDTIVENCHVFGAGDFVYGFQVKGGYHNVVRDCTVRGVARVLAQIGDAFRDRGDAPWSTSDTGDARSYPYPDKGFDEPDERRASWWTVFDNCYVSDAEDYVAFFSTESIGTRWYNCTAENVTRRGVDITKNHQDATIPPQDGNYVIRNMILKNCGSDVGAGGAVLMRSAEGEDGLTNIVVDGLLIEGGSDLYAVRCANVQKASFKNVTIRAISSDAFSFQDGAEDIVIEDVTLDGVGRVCANNILEAFGGLTLNRISVANAASASTYRVPGKYTAITPFMNTAESTNGATVEIERFFFPTDTSWYVEAEVHGVRTDTPGDFYQERIGFIVRNTSGTLAQVSTTTSLGKVSSNGAYATSLQFVDNHVRIRAAGDTGHTVVFRLMELVCRKLT